MKRFTKFMLSALSVLTVFSVSACNIASKPNGDSSTSVEQEQPQSNEIKVTFRQAGCEDVVVTVEKGAAIESVPVPVQNKAGYEISWNVKDFSAMMKDTLVETVVNPIVYTIKYELVRAEAKIPFTTQKATFDATVTLFTPTCKGYTFKGWKVKGTDEAFVSGKYQIAANVELYATWEKSDPWVNPFI